MKKHSSLSNWSVKIGLAAVALLAAIFVATKTSSIALQPDKATAQAYRQQRRVTSSTLYLAPIDATPNVYGNATSSPYWFASERFPNERPGFGTLVLEEACDNTTYVYTNSTSATVSFYFPLSRYIPQGAEVADVILGTCVSTNNSPQGRNANGSQIGVELKFNNRPEVRAIGTVVTNASTHLINRPAIKLHPAQAEVVGASTTMEISFGLRPHFSALGARISKLRAQVRFRMPQ